MRHGVHAHRAVVGLAERLGLLAQLVVGGGDEVVPGEEGQLALLGEGGGLAEGEPRGDTGGGAGRGAEELTSGRNRSIGRRHPGPPCGSMGDRTSRENPAGRVSPPRERVDGGDLVSFSTGLVKRRTAWKLPRPSFRTGRFSSW